MVKRLEPSQERGLINLAKDEFVGEIAKALRLERTDDQGRPNLSQLNIALRNIELGHLNLKFYGYRLARTLRDALPMQPAIGPYHVDLKSKASTQADMESAWVAYWCSELLTPLVFHRKLWELAYVLQAIYENGLLNAGARGLGFGCGEEPVASYLASKGASITVTDLAPEAAQAAGWAATHQHAASLDSAFQPEMLTRADFDRLVGLEHVDMNDIPERLRDYDFCWSICALEHLGSIDDGLRFIENSLRTIRVGGIAVHTTELNIAQDGPTIDNWPTVLFQRKHFMSLADRLRAEGHQVAELNFDLGDKPMDQFIDLPPWSHDLTPEMAEWLGRPLHLKVAMDGFASTCFGIIVKRMR